MLIENNLMLIDNNYRQVFSTIDFFTITTGILLCLLTNLTQIFNLCDVSTSESRQFVIINNKLTSVFHASVLLLTINFVKTLSK